MPTYNTRTFKENMKEAFKAAKSGQTILITRHDETFRLVLEDDLKPHVVYEMPGFSEKELEESLAKLTIRKKA